MSQKPMLPEPLPLATEPHSPFYNANRAFARLSVSLEVNHCHGDLGALRESHFQCLQLAELLDSYQSLSQASSSMFTAVLDRQAQRIREVALQLGQRLERLEASPVDRRFYPLTEADHAQEEFIAQGGCHREEGVQS